MAIAHAMWAKKAKIGFDLLLLLLLFSFTSLLTPHRTLVNTHKINKCAKFGSILLGVSREDDENIVSHRVSIKFWPSQEQDEIEMSERKKNHLHYLQINWHISFKTKSFSHVINHKNISSILKFWKLIHVIPTILKRSCLVLSYFEQDIKNAFHPQFHLSCTADISLTPKVYPYISTWFNMEMIWW